MYVLARRCSVGVAVVDVSDAAVVAAALAVVQQQWFEQSVNNSTF